MPKEILSKSQASGNVTGKSDPFERGIGVVSPTADKFSETLQNFLGKVRANVRFVPKTLQIDSQFVVGSRGGDGRLLKDKTG